MAFRFIILLAATALCLSGVQADGEVRHNSNTRPLELNVDAMSTYNDKFMALMKSPCRPEYDGFFGATYGDPISIRYGFRIETLPLSNIMDMLDVIEDKVVDSILSSTFPQMCGVHRRQLEQQPERKLGRQLSHASGFRFMKYQEVGKMTIFEELANTMQSLVENLHSYFVFHFFHQKNAPLKLTRLIFVVFSSERLTSMEETKVMRRLKFYQ